MRIVITGSSGVIGRHLASELVSYGHELICVDRAPASSGVGRSINLDLNDIEQVNPCLRGADGVVHLARESFPYTAKGYDGSTRTWRKPDYIGDAERFKANLSMTYNVLAASRAAGVRKL